MSVVSELIEQLGHLPEQRDRKRLNTLVESLTVKIREAHSRLHTSWSVRTFAQIVFPEEPFNKTTAAVRAASRQAAQLKEKLQGDFKEVGTSATENKVTRLGERGTEAEEGIRKTWPVLMQQQIRPYEALVGVAITLRLPGATALAAVMQRLRAHVAEPPASKEAADSLSSDLMQLRKCIADLGLQGEAGTFLVKASQGTADPRDLFKKEVKAFFDDQNLWNLLAVKTK